MKAAALSACMLAFAGIGCESRDGSRPPEEKTAEREIRSALERVGTTWQLGDLKKLGRYYDDSSALRLIESGRQYRGLSDFVRHHPRLADDEEIKSLRVSADRAEVHVGAGLRTAWSVRDVEIAGRDEEGVDFQAKGYETLVWQWKRGAWRIVHAHVSYQ